VLKTPKIAGAMDKNISRCPSATALTTHHFANFLEPSLLFLILSIRVGPILNMLKKTILLAIQNFRAKE
jgi:hypothetical protein